jgi:hypothetical protein
MKNYEQKWRRLVEAARAAREEESGTAAPYGFATRVAALAMTAPAENPWALFERFAVRGLLAAGVFSLAAAAFGLTALTNGDREDDPVSSDIVTEVLDLSS